VITKYLQRQLFFVALLIMLSSSFVKSQIIKKDTIVINDNSIESIIRYSANDTIHTDLKTRKLHLSGNAKVQMEDMTISAGYILIDFNTNEINASYRLDNDSSMIELPNFTDGNEIIICETLRYNIKTKKGFLKELAIKQDEFYFLMKTAKRQSNEEIHLKQGKLSTCDLINPHYHFQMSKGIIVPNKRIVSGPLNLHINGVPTPLGLPFAIIPNQKDKTSGLLFPEFIPLSQYGFGIQNLGYYIPINDKLQTSVYANLYSRGSWGLRNNLDYAKKYAFLGNLSLGFQQFRSGFPTNQNNNKFSVIWMHNKDIKSNPYYNFSSNVNFISDNNSKNNLDPINPEYFNNSFNSDININRLFPGKPLTMGLKISVRQNSLAKNISLISPIFNTNLTRVFPFKNLFKINNTELKKTISRIGISYNMEVQNRSTFQDSLIQQANFNAISKQFFNGIYQSATLQTSLGLIGNTIKINPSINYGNKINFQQIEKIYNSTLNNTNTDTLYRFGMAQEFNMSINITSILYSYFRVIGKSKPLMRHLMTPSIGYRYLPKLNSLKTSNAGINQNLITYSPFERSIYSAGNLQAASIMSFGLNNTLELKVKSEKDTLTGFKKKRLIDQLSFSGFYDFLKDSMQLSNIAINLRVSPTNWINFVSNASFSPYSWDSISGKTTSGFAASKGQGIGRILNTSFTTSFTIAPRKSREKITESGQQRNTNWDSDFNYFALHPEEAIYFDIPWKISFSHVYTLNANQAITSLSKEKFFQTQTLVINGDVSFTKRWNMSGNLNINVGSLKLTNAYISLNRNLHCWALSFYYVPVGGNRSFLLSIRNTSSIFKDAKIEFRKPPGFL
jgi:hypothetical protein